MISRFVKRCATCDADLLLRIGIGPMPEQNLVCQCPSCGVALRLRIETPGAPDIRFFSQDLLESDAPDDEGPSLPTLVLYADLPVHVDWLGGAAAPGVFPFIEWTRLWGARAGEYSARSNNMYALRQGLFPTVRRAASLYQLDEYERLNEALARLPLGDMPAEFGEAHVIYRLARLIDVLYVPFVDPVSRAAAINELLTHMVRCHREHRDAYRRLLEEFEQLGFAEHRRKTIQTCVDVLDHADALLPGLAWEHATTDSALAPGEFRIARDDFNRLRSRYVEIYELGSRTLAFTGAIANLSIRGSANHWAGGSTVSVGTMLRQRSAYQREFVVAELPLARLFYDDIRRESRNAFGHYNLEYDFASGELVDQDGTRTSYLLFLVDYLAAARLTSYLLGVVEKISLDYLDAPSEHRRVASLEDAATSS